MAILKYYYLQWFHFNFDLNLFYINLIINFIIFIILYLGEFSEPLAL